MMTNTRKSSQRSTKLSIEDYNRFQKYTNYAYEARVVEKP
jgi:hypothetical protein